MSEKTNAFSWIPKRIKVDKYMPYVMKRENGKYTVRLTEEETQAYNAEIAVLIRENETLEANLKEISDKIKTQIKSNKKKIKENANVTISGSKELKGDLYHLVMYSEDGLFRTCVYDQRGRLVSHRPASDSDRQMNLFAEVALLENKALAAKSAKEVQFEVEEEEVDHLSEDAY